VKKEEKGNGRGCFGGVGVWAGIVRKEIEGDEKEGG